MGSYLEKSLVIAVKRNVHAERKKDELEQPEGAEDAVKN